MPRHLIDLSKPDLEELFAGHGEPRYRAAQTARWALRRGVTTFAEMSNLPAGLRSTLAGELSLDPLPVVASTESDDGATIKVLFDLGGGDAVEAVRMDHASGDDPYEPEEPDEPEEPGAPEIPGAPGRPTARATVCVSTQVGCAIG